MDAQLYLPSQQETHLGRTDRRGMNRLSLREEAL